MQERLSLSGRWEANRLVGVVRRLGGCEAEVRLATENFERWVLMDNAVAGACAGLRAGVATDEMEARQRRYEAEKKQRQRSAS